MNTVKIKALKNYHGSDGYKPEGVSWEVSEHEAKELVKAGSVEIVKKAEKAVTEDKVEKVSTQNKSL